MTAQAEAHQRASTADPITVPRTSRIVPELADPQWLTVEHHQRGRTVIDIATELQVTPNAVRKALRRHSVEYRRDTRRPPELDGPRVLTAMHVDNGMGITEIADVLGVDTRTVSNALRRHGIPIRRSTPPVQYPALRDTGWLHERYAEDGCSVRQIAAEVGASPETVRAALIAAGVRLRPTAHHPS